MERDTTGRPRKDVNVFFMGGTSALRAYAVDNPGTPRIRRLHAKGLLGERRPTTLEAA